MFFGNRSAGLCSDNSTNNSTSVFLITFGSSTNNYSNSTPSSFNFTTSHIQVINTAIQDGYFGFVNAVPNHHKVWQIGKLDYATNEKNGYMFLVNVAKEKNTVIFNSTINDLCIGLRYEFSAYLANVDIPPTGSRQKPNVRFEVRAATFQVGILKNSSTGNIPAEDYMPWRKYGVTFIASNNSVVLLIISNVASSSAGGNDLAIDNIELRGCSNNYSRLCPSEETTTSQHTSSAATTTTIGMAEHSTSQHISSSSTTTTTTTTTIDMNEPSTSQHISSSITTTTITTIGMEETTTSQYISSAVAVTTTTDMSKQ
ncbi:unnamed protein product [Adineta steineri]|uniref:Uncharacterized protein n=1 Tax=Adineta steineri TaxID=433720 RepID=A0A815EPM6_9BILA|nr:unnamed protein product [Adineta steineri]CAF1583343.1 unnamed protein product [Adineta steineri]